MKQSTLPNQLLFEEFEDLIRKGRRVMLPVKGKSMMPFLREGLDKVVLEQAKELKVGDIVLAHLSDKRYVMHRIFERNGEQLILMGDGNVYGREVCTRDEVKAKAVCILRNGKKVDCDSKEEQEKVRLWKKLLPIRRYLLLYYRCIGWLKTIR